VPRGAVLVVDTMGELTALYAVADVAFVGGSLYYRGSNKGGHNLMEPAAQGIPVLFGPYNFSFKEIAEDLLQAGAARLVCDAAELGAAVTELLDDADRRQAMGAAAQRVVTGGQGAAARNYALIRAMLRSSVTSTHNAAISD
jgi:3-deoxy-D-manno-octulosonic-acid transferase